MHHLYVVQNHLKVKFHLLNQSNLCTPILHINHLICCFILSCILITFLNFFSSAFSCFSFIAFLPRLSHSSFLFSKCFLYFLDMYPNLYHQNRINAALKGSNQDLLKQVFVSSLLPFLDFLFNPIFYGQPTTSFRISVLTKYSQLRNALSCSSICQKCWVFHSGSLGNVNASLFFSCHSVSQSSNISGSGLTYIICIANGHF